MASKKFKVHCRIMDYVDSVDPELGEILKGTCTDMTLGSTKGKGGVTFLMPQDKAFRKKISDLAYSDKVEDANLANDMLNSIIFRDVFKSGDDWMKKKDDIPNSLMPAQHVEVEKATQKEVTFKSGAKAVLDENFIDGSRKKNLAVWKLVSGEIPITNDRPASLKYTRKNNRNKMTGGNEHTQSQGLRAKIVMAVENAFLLHHLQKQMGSDIKFGANDQYGGEVPVVVPLEQRPRDAYLEHTLSLLNYINKVWQGPGKSLLLDKILPLISYNKIDFYLLIEPYKKSDYLIDDNLITEWWLQKSKHKISLRAVMADMRKLLDEGSNALVYTDRPKLIELINTERKHLLGRIAASPRGCIGDICRFYDTLAEENKIGGVGPVYPSGLAEIYKSEPSLKLLQDELRYLTFLQFSKLESEPVFDAGKFREITDIICDYMSAQNGHERENCVKLLNKNTIRYLIAPTERLKEISIFLKSTYFSYVPLTEKDILDSRMKTVIIRPDPSDLKIFNIHGAVMAKNKRLLDSEVDQSDAASIVSALKSLDVSTLDPDLREQIVNKFRD